ncbi:hypothetical protein AAF712_006588 [Marasmius tenuissimus]|uniref:F-box domain-containing protein n=1 Tax=Marasmius tenuissimus TaxID=585030 RepID=A0ABR2ZXC7_9AGAR
MSPDLDVEVVKNVGETHKEVQPMNKDYTQSSLISVGQLAVDLLVEIFTFQVDDILHYQHDVKVDDWLAFAQVCQHWRTVALEATTLWSFPDFRIPKLVPLMLERSKSAPLTLKVDLALLEDEEPVEGVLTKVLEEHMGRTVALYVSASRKFMESVLITITAPAAPILQTLTLQIAELGSSGSFDTLEEESITRHGPPVELELPENLFGGKTPSLKSVELDGLGLGKSYGSSILRDLTSLSLSFFERNGPCQLAASQALAILENCPALEKLHIPGGLTKGDYAQGATHTPFELPEIRQLDLSGDLPILCLLLDHVASFPGLETAALRVSLEPSWNRWDLSRVMKRVLNSPNLSIPPCLYIAITSKPTPYAALNFFPSLSELHIPGPVRVVLTSQGISDADVCSSVSTVLDVAPLSGLQTAVVDHYPIPVDIITEYFGIQMNSLEHLILIGTSGALSFLDALGRTMTTIVEREGSEAGGDSGGGQYLFQALRTIEFHGLDFANPSFTPVMWWTHPVLVLRRSCTGLSLASHIFFMQVSS